MSESLQSKFPKITEAGLEALRKRIGAKIRVRPEPWCYEATRDNIRHYAHGIGDDNPLWCDPAYAAGTPHGGIVAPPSFLFACDRIVSGYVGGLPGIHAMWAGADWTFHRWVERNDEIGSEARLKEVIPRQTSFSGLAVQQVYRVSFRNQRGELVAEADSWCFRTERDFAREAGTKYDALKQKEPKRYSQQELDAIYALYEKEEVRGAEPRYFEDVAEGQPLPPMAKGPMTVTGFIAFAQGWGGLYIRSNKLAWRQVSEHPGLGIPNDFNIPDCPERVHWEPGFARMVGAPDAYDYGPERCSWMMHHLTNWMGDDGFLKKAHTKIRRHNPAGDALFIEGKVVRKFEENGESCVEIQQQALNQDGELSLTASGVVVLPRRG
ncbi:MAG: MaoC family dehydratase N-terminal domain-containing protein [bacterium]